MDVLQLHPERRDSLELFERPLLVELADLPILPDSLALAEPVSVLRPDHDYVQPLQPRLIKDEVVPRSELYRTTCLRTRHFLAQ